MNPIGRHFGLLKASDMMLIDMATGQIVGGNRVSILFCVNLPKPLRKTKH